MRIAGLDKNRMKVKDGREDKFVGGVRNDFEVENLN